MSAFLTLDQVSAATPDGTLLFSDLTLSLGHERIGLTGRNGSGKSTLFSLIKGERAPLSGSVSHGGRIASLQQWPDEAGSIADLLGVREPLDCLARMLSGQPDSATARQHASELRDEALEQKRPAAKPKKRAAKKAATNKAAANKAAANKTTAKKRQPKKS